MPLQGTAADIMKIAMIELHKELEPHRESTRILLQVHDEMVLEVAEPFVSEIAQIVKRTMESVAVLAVPLVTELSVGPNWEDLTELEVNL